MFCFLLGPTITSIVLTTFVYVGSLSGDRVRCPWHGACFNTRTGDIEDFPGLDSLHVFEVKHALMA